MSNPNKSLYVLYGITGIPLAFGALPLYMHLPKIYSEQSALSLTTIGIILWAVRLFDAITDPFFGTIADKGNLSKLFRISLIAFLIGFIFLCHPMLETKNVALQIIVLVVLLIFTSVAFSAANIAFLTWGADLGKTSTQRTQLVGYREVITLIAVIVAAITPALVGDDFSHGVKILSYCCAILVVIAITTSQFLPTKKHNTAFSVNWRLDHYWHQLLIQFRLLWNDFASRYLLICFVLNGIASAIPATLFFFYAEDVLGLKNQSSIFLLLYFLAGVVTLPLWLWACRHFSRIVLWQLSMLIAIGGFTVSGFLNTDDLAGFIFVCVVTGCALGADLSLPTSMAADCGKQQNHTGILFGWWNLLTKFNLAAAAVISLPFLAFMGYSADAGINNTTALKWSYVFLPIIIKVSAFVVLTHNRKHLQSIK